MSPASTHIPHAIRALVRRVLRRAASSFLLAALAGPAHAAWPSSPAVNLPVCTASGAQYFRSAIPDGQGGMIIAWSDERSDTADVYAQRVSAAGVALWTPQGVRICGAPWQQGDVTMLADGAGGAFVAWRDDRKRWESDIHAQRIDANGTPQWAADGVAVCRMPGDQLAPRLARSDFSTVIVVWEDRRLTSGTYAQRLSATGVRLWDTSGVALSSAAPPRFEPVAASDGVGGAIVAWTQQGANGHDIVAQRVDDVGQLLWGATGRLIAGGPGEQIEPAIIEGELYRVYLAWEDDAGGSSTIRLLDLDILGATRFSSMSGLALSQASRAGKRPTLVRDRATGAIVTWHETLVGSQDIRAQRVAPYGALHWPAGGALVCGASGVQQFPTLVSDGRGGALIAWEDLRTGAWDIHAQRMDSLGLPKWGANGRIVSSAPSSQLGPFIVGELDSVAIVVWTDQRSGGTDIHAQQIPLEVTLDVPLLSGPRIALASSPNPSRLDASIEFTLAETGPVMLTLHDAAGRIVRDLSRPTAPAGPQRVLWDGLDDRGLELPPGIYLARLIAAGREGRLTLVRTR